MNILARNGLVIACWIAASGVACAETAKPAAPAPNPAPTTAPAPPVAAKPTPAAASAAPKPAAATASPAPAGTMSESKFLGALYSEIAKRTPEENAAGPGEVTASFHVAANGRIDKVTIDRTSSQAHAEIVKKILASVAAPPPPGGSMDVGQTFRFR